jgi:hypothetical protein
MSSFSEQLYSLILWQWTALSFFWVQVEKFHLIKNKLQTCFSNWNIKRKRSITIMGFYDSAMMLKVKKKSLGKLDIEGTATTINCSLPLIQHVTSSSRYKCKTTHFCVQHECVVRISGFQRGKINIGRCQESMWWRLLNCKFMLSWGMTLHRAFGESRLFQWHIKLLLYQTELCLLDLL